MYQSVPFYRSGWNGNFRYKYLENHTVYFVENYMVVKLKYCRIRFYLFYFFKIINYHFNSEYFTFKLVVKLLSALSVNTVLAYRYFWLSVKLIWSFLTLSIERPWSNHSVSRLTTCQNKRRKYFIRESNQHILRRKACQIRSFYNICV